MTAPRGIRLHNPGNVKFSEILWNGEVRPSQDDVFCQFQAPWYGIRAMAMILTNYYTRHGLTTVAGMIGRYAPKGGKDKNNTSQYARYVAGQLKVPADYSLKLDYYTLESLVRAMIFFENGQQPYSWELATGLIMDEKGIEPTAVILDDGRLSYGFVKNGL